MTKEILREYLPKKQELAQIRELLREIEADRYSPDTASPDSARRTKHDKALEYIDTGGDIVALYRQKAHELEAKLLEIERAIESMEPRERTLLRLHYVRGMTWENVCVEMGYSWRQVHRIHSKALERLKNT